MSEALLERDHTVFVGGQWKHGRGAETLEVTDPTSGAVLARLQAGDNVALVSDAGTPLISDPGYRLVQGCHRTGVRVVPVPGASALLAALVAAGAIDGLSIGYRTVTAAKNDQGRRVLTELELWEVSLVTFPMLPSARVAAKGSSLTDDTLRELAAAFEDARQEMARMS